MNKVFTKIAGLSVGLALAIGVGVVVGSKEAKVAKAADVLVYTLDGTVTGGSNGYATESDITQSGVSWKATGNTTINPWRIGGNSITNQDRPIYSTGAISDDVSKVEVNSGAASGITINSLTISIHSTATDAANGSNAIASKVESTGSNIISNTVSLEKTGTADWSGKFYRIVYNVTKSGTGNKFIEFNYAKFYKASTAPRGEIEIGDVSPVITVGDSDSLSYTWTPASGSSATISSHTWASSDSTILSISGDTYTAAAPGVVTLTLNATDSIGEEYSVTTSKIFVTNAYTFEIGDNVALYSSGASKELSGINKDNTHFGIGTDYTDSPAGLFALTVEAGTETGTFSFKNGDDYLYWTSGNSLSSSTTKSIKTSWFVVAYDDYMIISNAADLTREVWWNSGNPRFACYQGKTTESSGYNSVSLAVIEDVPVRGTIAITAPTETLLRQGASATATFSWTAPEEAPSTTIASHTWTSSDTAVFSVSGDTYTAVGPGKAKLTLNATDSNGQDYTSSTKDITVVSVVSGSYEKVYSVSVGDTVAIVCEAAETELSGVASKIGTYVFYDDAPASIYDFTLEEGSVEGSYALASSEGTYLAWTGGGSSPTAADIGLVESVQESSSWTIVFEDGNAKISNCALDGEAHRYLAWNNNSPRFAAYKQGQTAIQLYAPATVIEESALTFANAVINELTCDATGKTAPSTSEWEDLEDAYSAVTAAGKTQLKEIFAVHHESPATDKEVLEEAMAKYDYVVGKYGSSAYADFIERDPAPIPSGRISDLSIEAGNNTMIIVVVIASVSALAFTTLLVFKKKKQK